MGQLAPLEMDQKHSTSTWCYVRTPHRWGTTRGGVDVRYKANDGDSRAPYCTWCKVRRKHCTMYHRRGGSVASTSTAEWITTPSSVEIF